MSHEVVHQELLTLDPFSLVGIGWVSRKPEVVVYIKMGILEMLG
jgi:hypothetical protein